MTNNCIVCQTAKSIVRKMCRKCYNHWYTKNRNKGNFVDTRHKNLKRCRIEHCTGWTTADGLCAKHYARRWRHGSTDSLIPNYGLGITQHSQGYIRIKKGDKWFMEHILLAEKALGRSLPPKAVVHHTGAPDDNHGFMKLIVCPDQAYHFLLHKRAEEMKLYGRCFTTSYGKTSEVRRALETKK